MPDDSVYFPPLLPPWRGYGVPAHGQDDTVMIVITQLQSLSVVTATDSMSRHRVWNVGTSFGFGNVLPENLSGH